MGSWYKGYEFSLSKKEKTSKISIRNNAVLAINGTAAGFNERSYVIRNGIVYKDTRLNYNPLVIQNNGDFIIYDEQLTGEELVERVAMYTYDFGSDLIRNSEIVDYRDTWYKENLALRTVIDQKEPLEYVILVVDVRSKASVGMSHYDISIELKNRGCYWGYNLDGGGSNTLYFDGEVLNNPSRIVERKI